MIQWVKNLTAVVQVTAEELPHAMGMAIKKKKIILR